MISPRLTRRKPTGLASVDGRGRIDHVIYANADLDATSAGSKPSSV
jgi:hypothetical protein